MANIKVALRIRPISCRELEITGSEVVVRTDLNEIYLTNLKVSSSKAGDSRERTRRYGFDYCFDSSNPHDEQHASQETIYDTLGRSVLDALFSGYNSCLVAYGQSASGKTYTMMGSKDDPGLTPRLCRGLFSRMEEEERHNRVYRVSVSYLEIYNERVRDLLQPSTNTNGLRIREHPRLGPYVQGLTHHVVSTLESLMSYLEEGTKARKTASTLHNPSSSRSHALLTVALSPETGNGVDRKADDSKPSRSDGGKLRLVDLAGSESAAMCTGVHRLKEGANINKSLVALGNVISALAERGSNGNNSGRKFIPYRDSSLTWLLKDALGGNATTVMLATISPASCSYNETAHTLRFAQRAQSVINRPMINEDPVTRIIRELKAEVTRLKSLLLEKNIDPVENPPLSNACNCKKDTETSSEPQPIETTLMETNNNENSSFNRAQIIELQNEGDVNEHGFVDIPTLVAVLIKPEDNCRETSSQIEEICGDEVVELFLEQESVDKNLETRSKDPASGTTKSSSNLHTSKRFGSVEGLLKGTKDTIPFPLERTLTNLEKRTIGSDKTKKLNNIKEIEDSKTHNRIGSLWKSINQVGRRDQLQRKGSNDSDKSSKGSITRKPSLEGIKRKTSKDSSSSSSTKDDQTSTSLLLRRKSLLDQEETSPRPHTPIQKIKRSDIVAAVTERLYSSKKLTEESNPSSNVSSGTRTPPTESTDSKVPSPVMRSKLQEISRKMLTKRRRVHVDTQTEKHQTIRVRDTSSLTDQCKPLSQDVAILTDTHDNCESFVSGDRNFSILRVKEISTLTDKPKTTIVRCKDVESSATDFDDSEYGSNSPRNDSGILSDDTQSSTNVAESFAATNTIDFPMKHSSVQAPSGTRFAHQFVQLDQDRNIISINITIETPNVSELRVPVVEDNSGIVKHVGCQTTELMRIPSNSSPTDGRGGFRIENIFNDSENLQKNYHTRRGSSFILTNSLGTLFSPIMEEKSTGMNDDPILSDLEHNFSDDSLDYNDGCCPPDVVAHTKRKISLQKELEKPKSIMRTNEISGESYKRVRFFEESSSDVCSDSDSFDRLGSDDEDECSILDDYLDEAITFMRYMNSINRYIDSTRIFCQSRRYRKKISTNRAKFNRSMHQNRTDYGEDPMVKTSEQSYKDCLRGIDKIEHSINEIDQHNKYLFEKYGINVEDKYFNNRNNMNQTLNDTIAHSPTCSRIDNFRIEPPWKNIEFDCNEGTGEMSTPHFPVESEQSEDEPASEGTTQFKLKFKHLGSPRARFLELLNERRKIVERTRNTSAS